MSEEINLFKSELSQMERRLAEMEEKINNIDTKLTQVVDAILGNPLTKTGGFLSEVDELKKRIAELEAQQQQHEEFKKKISWTVGIAVGIAILIQYVSSVWSNLKN